MRIRLSRQTVTQAALTVVLLTLLCAVYRSTPRQAVAPLEGVAQQAVRAFVSDGGDEDLPQDKLEELRTMPAYRTAQRTVVALNAARGALLTAAAAADAQATDAAAADYHRTLEHVGSALAALRDYTDPAEYDLCLQDLFTMQTEEDLGGPVIQESHLGILPPVGNLPREIVP